MSIIRKNFKRYAKSLIRSFLGGAIFYLGLMQNSGQELTAKTLGALLMGAGLAGIIGALKACQEILESTLDSYKAKRTGQQPNTNNAG